MNKPTDVLCNKKALSELILSTAVDFCPDRERYNKAMASWAIHLANMVLQDEEAKEKELRQLELIKAEQQFRFKLGTVSDEIKDTAWNAHCEYLERLNVNLP